MVSILAWTWSIIDNLLFSDWQFPSFHFWNISTSSGPYLHTLDFFLFFFCQYVSYVWCNNILSVLFSTNFFLCSFEFHTFFFLFCCFCTTGSYVCIHAQTLCIYIVNLYIKIYIWFSASQLEKHWISCRFTIFWFLTVQFMRFVIQCRVPEVLW